MKTNQSRKSPAATERRAKRKPIPPCIGFRYTILDEIHITRACREALEWMHTVYGKGISLRKQ